MDWYQQVGFNPGTFGPQPILGHMSLTIGSTLATLPEVQEDLPSTPGRLCVVGEPPSPAGPSPSAGTPAPLPGDVPGRSGEEERECERHKLDN